MTVTAVGQGDEPMKYVYTYPFDGVNGPLGNVIVAEVPGDELPPDWWRSRDHDKHRVEEVTPGAIKWHIARQVAIEKATELKVPALIGGISSQIMMGEVILP